MVMPRSFKEEWVYQRGRRVYMGGMGKPDNRYFRGLVYQRGSIREGEYTKLVQVNQRGRVYQGQI